MLDKNVIDDLMRMSIDYTFIPSDDMYHILMRSFKTSGTGVASTFFDGVYSETYFCDTLMSDKISRLASIMMCNTMRTVSSKFKDFIT